MVEKASGRCNQQVDTALQLVLLGLTAGAADDDSVCLCMVLAELVDFAIDLHAGVIPSQADKADDNGQTCRASSRVGVMTMTPAPFRGLNCAL